MLKRIVQYGCMAVGLLSFYGCPDSWYERYDYEGKEPFDVYALYELFSARPEGTILVEDSLSVLQEDTLQRSNYFFIGQYAYYGERSVTELLDYVERGNTAFIAAYELPEDLASHLFGDECYYNIFYNDDRFPYFDLDTVTFQLNDGEDHYELVNVHRHKPVHRTMYYLNDALFCDEYLGNETLGLMDTLHVNYARLPWGEGNFYFLSSPIFLTNYYLVDGQKYQYAEATLSVLGEGPVYWDEFSRVPPSVARQRAPRNYSGGRNLLQGNETLSYVQEQPPLALAWYGLLLGGFLFILFRGKRRQRIIPIIKPRENSSKRFMDTISRLLFQKGHHAALAKQELGNLRHHLHDRFGVRWREGEPPPENLGELIGAPSEVMERALKEIRMVQNSKSVEEYALVRFYRAIEPLYTL
ncbi:DUF4350 domain-containing protein [Lewinella sp. W8]|uniref:DUF4350 domain-containing protein n=1 Tax=Lewinella sp. W8 TaxID=2528208 RepID=UPI001067C141|nr:DUF4350 domain-containing protein [Lewinella sp. W8]MTB53731.1 hypothetical protein [Lewinella sp. W8]